MAELTLDRYRGVLADLPAGRTAGRVTHIVGLAIEVRGIRLALGELCRVVDGRGGDRLAEVVGFREDAALLLPLGESTGLAPGDPVLPLGRELTVACHESMLGRVVDAVGRPIDDGPPLAVAERRAIAGEPLPALSRPRITRPLETGVAALDGLLTVGMGQRLGIFAGSGVGKSTLMGSLARSSRADVNVIALIGERGREVVEFIETALGPEGLARSVVVVAPSDDPVLMRQKAAFTAMAIAEFFRDRGKDVLVMMDSITRLANASREIGLALGEPPTVRGYPPSFFGTMPKIVERMGLGGKGSITGLLTVLVDADDMNEPVADTMRGLLDGHIVLSRKIAERGQYPAIDVLQSISRVMGSVTLPEHGAAAREFRKLLATYEDVRDLVAVGAYKRGGDPEVDRAVSLHPALVEFLRQSDTEHRGFEDTLRRLFTIARTGAPGARR
ncbi:MAG: FliI/YscN family ATPase [Planctomycetota bacterium]